MVKPDGGSYDFNVNCPIVTTVSTMGEFVIPEDGWWCVAIYAYFNPAVGAENKQNSMYIYADGAGQVTWNAYTAGGSSGWRGQNDTGFIAKTIQLSQGQLITAAVRQDNSNNKTYTVGGQFMYWRVK